VTARTGALMEVGGMPHPRNQPPLSPAAAHCPASRRPVGFGVPPAAPGPLEREPGSDEPVEDVRDEVRFLSHASHHHLPTPRSGCDPVSARIEKQPAAPVRSARPRAAGRRCRRHPTPSGATLGLLACAVLALGSWVLVERRARQPMVDMRMMALRGCGRPTSSA
jgi:hypothetical protein